MHFPHQQLNGILKYFYSRPGTTIWDFINASVGSEFASYPMVNAFNFDTTNYWYGKDDSFENYLIFCLKDHFATLEVYELGTSGGGSRPKKWSFSGSNDNSTWNDEVQTEYSMISNEIKYIPWSYGPFKCFKLRTISSIDNQKRFDVRYIEIFGHLYPDESKNTHPISCKCNHLHFTNSMFLLIFIFTVIY